MNSTMYGPGRLGNHFIRNILSSEIARKGNLVFFYYFEDKFNKLGIEFFHGHVFPSIALTLTDANVMVYVNAPKMSYSVEVCEMYGQIPEASLFIYKYLRARKTKNTIMVANNYKERYMVNNDVYVHVRLGDVEHLSPGFSYYDSALSNIKFNKGYISSDSPEHPIIKELIEKWNLEFLNKEEIDLIQFASTCKYIIASHGTFSYMIAALAFFSVIFYPPKRYGKWCGDIWVVPEWKCIEFESSV